MKAKQLTLLLILLVVFGGVGLFFYNRNAESWKKSASTVKEKIVSFSLNDVSHVTIKTSAAEVNLVKKDDVWKVKERADYPANFEMISGLIRKVWELPAVQDVQAGPSQFGRLQLLPPDQGANSGTLLDLKDGKDKRLAALLLGKKYMRESPDLRAGEGGIPVGRYVKAEGGTGGVVLVSDTLNEVEPEPKQWLDHDFIKIENPKSITIAGATPELNWKVARNSASDSWEFVGAKPGEKVDSAKVSAVVNSLSASTFTDVLAPDAKPAETGLDHPATGTIETFDGFVYTLRVGKVNGENYPVLVSVTAQLSKERTPGKDEKPEDKTRLDQEFRAKQKQLADKLASEKKLETRPYLISKTAVDGFLRDRNSLLPDKPAASPSPAATPSPKPAASKTGRRGKPK
jgi:uncharacterized protein DUF4340